MKNQDNTQSIPSSYEQALKELQEILDNLENQSISVDELTNHTTRAKFLIRFCQQKIRGVEAETKDLL